VRLARAAADRLPTGCFRELGPARGFLGGWSASVSQARRDSAALMFSP
jgi:hypothetical protein